MMQFGASRVAGLPIDDSCSHRESSPSTASLGFHEFQVFACFCQAVWMFHVKRRKRSNALVVRAGE